jgi:triacylglycerol lipase
MKKKLPPSTFNELRPPNMDYRYFENWKDHHFIFDATDYEAVNAWWLAEVSLLAYADSAFTEDVLNEVGLRSEAGLQMNTINGAITNTQGFILHNNDLIIISFRGTQLDSLWGFLRDLQTGLEFSPGEEPGGGHVHHGFKEAVDEVWDDIHQHLSRINQDGRTRGLWFTGHSLGAALATVAASRFGSGKVQGIYTYGSPRVGDIRFAQQFSAKAFRFVNQNDIITKVPPPGLYRHVGEVKYIDDSGHVHSQMSAWDVLENAISPGIIPRFESIRDSVFGADIPLPGFIADHAPVYYATYLYNALNE